MSKQKLKDCCEIVTGNTPKTSVAEYYSSHDIPFFKPGDFNSGAPRVLVEPESWLSECARNVARIVSSGAVLVTCIGIIGKVGIADDELAFNQQINAAIPTSALDSQYLAHQLAFRAKQFSYNANKAVVPILNKTSFGEIEIIVPDSCEQKAVVDTLKYFLQQRSNAYVLLNQLDELVKSRFVEMFGDKYPEDTLLNLCNIIDYRGKTPEKAESGLPFITAKNVKMHYMALEPREYISKETYDKVMVRGFPKEGDVVFTTEAPLGNVCRIPHFDTEFYIGQRIVTMQTDVLVPTYLEYALSSEEFVKKYKRKSSGSTVTGIKVRLLEQLTVPVPPIKEQQKFAAFVSQVDKLKCIAQQQIDKLQMLYDSLAQEYFSVE